MFHRVFAAIALGIALALALLMWPTRVPASTTDSDLRKAAPDFNLNDSKGFPLKLSDYKGRVVLLDFWATWCHGCKTEIPWYMEFERKYKRRGLAVIGVSMDDDGWKSVRPFLREHQLNYPVAIGNQDLAKMYGVDSMPVTLLIDREGKIADSHSGVVNKDGFEREIQTLLQERLK
jgi:peroxiredoxin